MINPTIDFTWKQIGSNTFTNNYGISPDGKQNSTLIEFGGTSASYQVYNQINFSSGQYTTSIYAKGSGSFKFGFYDNSSVLTDTINLTSDWQRFEVTKTLSATTSGRGVWLYPNGDGDTIEVYGAQVEQGSYPTSYIPTYGTSTTRVADSCSKTGISELIGQTEGTLFAEFAVLSDDNADYRLSISDGTSSNWIFVAIPEDGVAARMYVRINNTALIDINQNEFSQGNTYKIAFAYKSGESAIYINGISKITSTTSFGSPSSPFTDFGISGSTAGTNTPQLISSNLNQAILFPTRLTNDQLEQLTK